jgi:hypothetical protein
MSFIEELRRARGEDSPQAVARTEGDKKLPFVELLRKNKQEALRRSTDPWRMRLERVRGEVGYDGIERISTQILFDHLEIPQRGRNAGACRYLAKLMRELGWTSMKTRSLAQSGFRDQVRGYARDTRARTKQRA